MTPRIYLGFLPWVVFAFVGRTVSGGVAWGAAAALATAVIIAVASARSGSVTLLGISAVALFAGLTVVGALDQHDAGGFLQQYFRAIAAGAMTLIAFVSTRFTPFTEPYTRQIVPRKFWETPRFKRVNAELSRIWATTFFTIALSFTAAALINSHAGSTVLNWIVPIGLTLRGVRAASRLWDDEYDHDSMTLDAMLDQTDLWEFAEENQG
jgi:hypothetical protein